MIKLEELTEASKGRKVVYLADIGRFDHGVITSWNEKYIFVRYDGFGGGVATPPEALTWVTEVLNADVCFNVGTRIHLENAAAGDGDYDHWEIMGKYETSQAQGDWESMAILAAMILSHPNTLVTAPNLYRPELVLTEEQKVKR